MGLREQLDCRGPSRVRFEPNCEGDLECYEDGPGQSFCTQACNEDADCMDLTSAMYTCSEDGLCEIECDGFQDIESCPAGLSCLMVDDPGPGGSPFRCKYSRNAGESGNGEAWSACLTPDDCDEGLQCAGATGPIPGYCAQPCEEPAQCTEEPESGDIEPTCEEVGTPGAMACTLDCTDDEEGCPEDMVCGFGHRCVY